MENATQAFADTGIQITTEGKHHLGAAIGSPMSMSVTKSMNGWLAHVTTSQPHAAYAAFSVCTWSGRQMDIRAENNP